MSADRSDVTVSQTASSQRRVICARCGADFACGTASGDDGGCWCAAEPYRVPMPVAAGEDCLCPSCLRAHARRFETEARR